MYALHSCTYFFSLVQLSDLNRAVELTPAHYLTNLLRILSKRVVSGMVSRQMRDCRNSVEELKRLTDTHFEYRNGFLLDMY